MYNLRSNLQLGKESTTPLLKSLGFGKSAFGITRKGSRTATPKEDNTRPGGENFQSICGLETCKDKIQEEF